MRWVDPSLNNFDHLFIFFTLDLKKAAAVFIIMQNLQEDANQLFLHDATTFPQIEVIEEIDFEGTNTFSIIAEGTSICVCCEFTEAVALMFASFYLFNLQFPKKLKSSMTFFREYIFNIQDNIAKIDKKVAKFCTTLSWSE